jgi:hypothetical protein
MSIALQIRLIGVFFRNHVASLIRGRRLWGKESQLVDIRLAHVKFGLRYYSTLLKNNKS